MFRSINRQSIALGASSRCEPTFTDVPVYVIWPRMAHRDLQRLPPLCATLEPHIICFPDA
jgi:hypothetical protein